MLRKDNIKFLQRRAFMRLLEGIDKFQFSFETLFFLFFSSSCFISIGLIKFYSKLFICYFAIQWLEFVLLYTLCWSRPPCSMQSCTKTSSRVNTLYVVIKWSGESSTRIRPDRIIPTYIGLSNNYSHSQFIMHFV